MASILTAVSIAGVSKWIDPPVGRAGARSGSKVRKASRAQRERSENWNR
jgi:hypothetical protein